MEEQEVTAYDRMKENISRAKESASRIMTKALEDRSLIEEMDVELQDIADELENKETELLGGEKVEDETTEESTEVEMRMDTNPASPTYNTMIPVNA